MHDSRKVRAGRLVAEGADRLEHVRDEGQRGVGRGEGRHDLAGVRLDAEAVEAGHLQALGGRDEAEDADLREAAVVDLREERLLLALGRHLGGEAERIPQVEGHRVREGRLVRARELGEVARLAAAHVVLLAVGLEHEAGLGPHLEEADDHEDLQLRRGGERIPLVGRAARRRDVSEADGRERRARADAAERALDVPREADAVGLDAVANERGHRDAAVLDLGVAEPADRLRRRLSDVERVPEANHRVELLGELLEAGLVRDLARRPRLGVEGHLIGEAHLHRRGAAHDGRGRRVRERRKGNSGQHGWRVCVWLCGSAVMEANRCAAISKP
mmetsp:Transcript_63856/g.170303  ORF Transcript_63856/g.170303 Transcript_63856/m.170303 type:complete len:331 (+) Transcript_63856:281-1273(+)